MRVLHLLTSSGLGGGPKYVQDLVRRLPIRFTHLVAAPSGGDCYFRDMVVLPLDRLNPMTLLDVAILVKRHDIDVIHSHGKGAGLYGRLAGCLTRRPTVHTFHGIHAYAGIKRRAYLAMERWLGRITSAVIHVSRSQASEALGLGLNGQTVVSGIDVVAVSQVSQALNWPWPDAEVIGTVCRLDPVKRVDLLIEVVRQLVPTHPMLVLFIVGGGPDEARLKALADPLGSHVIFLGAKPEAAQYMPNFRVYVSASEREGLPLSLLEAMAYAVPVVATMVSGHVDVVDHGATGWLAPSAADMAPLISRLLRNTMLRRSMGEAGLERVTEHFSLDREVAEMQGIYESVAR